MMRLPWLRVPQTLQIRTWQLCVVALGIFMLQHNCQKICPTTALTAEAAKDAKEAEEDVNGLFGTCCDFYRRHTRCVWSSRRSRSQRQIPCPVPVSDSDSAGWSSFVCHACHTYCPCPMAIINCSLRKSTWLGCKFQI